MGPMVHSFVLRNCYEMEQLFGLCVDCMVFWFVSWIIWVTHCSYPCSKGTHVDEVYDSQVTMANVTDCMSPKSNQYFATLTTLSYVYFNS